VTLSAASGTGNGGFPYSVAASASAASRTATVTVTPSSGAAVTLTVSQSGGVLTVSPASANAAASGGTGSISLTADNAALQWAASSGQPWLTITSSASGTGSANLQWAAAANSQGSTRSAAITITPLDGTPQTFTVSQQGSPGTLAITPSSLAFSFQLGSSAPSNSILTVTSAGAALPIAAAASTSSGGNWLAVAGGGSTPGALTVSVTTSGLAAGVYQGTVTVTSSGATNSPLAVPVTLKVTAAPVISSSPPALNFSFQQNGPTPATQTINLTGSAPVINPQTGASAPLAFTIAGDPGASWLMVAAASGATAGSVTINPAALQPGQYTANLQISAPGAANSPLLVPVTLTVTAAATLVASPGSLSLNYRQLDPAPSPIAIAVVSSASPLNFTASVSASTPWLSVSGGGQTPSNIQVAINPSGLTPGSYHGVVILTSPGAGNNPLQIPVTLTVTAGLTLTAQPSQVSFQLTPGSAPGSAQIAISSDSPISFTASAATSSGGNWLTVQSSGGTTPSVVTVTAQTGALAAGAYTGAITLTSAQAGNSPVAIPVSLTVSPQPPLTVTPQTLSFSYQISGSLPAAQTIAISSPGAAGASVKAAATTTSGGAWLQVSAGVTTPGTLPVTVNPAALPAGVYAGTVTLTSPGYATVKVSVSLKVSAAPLLTVQPTSLSFTYQHGGALPPAQTVSAGSSSTALTFTAAANSPWLTATGAGTTPASVSVAVNPANLTPGTYTGSFALTSPGAGNSPLIVPVTLLITPATAISAAPASLSFTYTQHGSLPPSQTLSIAATPPLNFSPSVSSGASWLTVSGQGPTPSKLVVSVSPAALAPGNYSASITIAAPGAANTPLTVAVALLVSAAPSITPSPAKFSFAWQSGTALPPAQTLVVTSSAASLPVTASAASATGGAWLSVTGGSSTPAVITLAANPSGLQPGTYQGSITLSATAAGNSPLVLPVTLVVGAAPVLQTSIDHLSFSYQVGQSLPAASTVLVSSTGAPISFQASGTTDSGGAWLRVSGGSTTQAPVTVGVDITGLAPGTYTGTAALTAATASNSPLSIPVTLTVSAEPVLVATPAAVAVTTQQNGAALPPQMVHLDSSVDPPLTYSASPGSGWLSFTGPPATPGDLAISFSTAGLAPGRYSAAVVVSSPSAANSPLRIPVTFDVVAAPSLAVTPTALMFSYQIGQTTPPQKTLSITSSSSSTPLDFSVSTLSGAPWLIASGAGQTPGAATVAVNPGALGAGTYTGSVLISSTTAANFVSVPVILTVAQPASLVVSPSVLTFSYEVGATPPAPVNLTVTSAGAPQTVAVAARTFSGGNWLALSSSGATPFAAVVTAVPTGLAPGVYQGQISLTPSGAGSSPVVVPVTLTIKADADVIATPTALTFASPLGGPVLPEQQVVLTSSDGQPLALSTASPGNRWLTAWLTASTTPATLSVAANPAGLAQGVYSSEVIVSSSTSGDEVTIPVTLTVSGQALLSANPASATFVYSIGGPAPAPISLAIGSSAGPISFSPTNAGNSPWLSVSGAGNTPAAIQASVNPTGLAPGDYESTILVSGEGAANSPLGIPVHLLVTGGPVLLASPSTLVFTGGSTRQQMIHVTGSTSSLNFSAAPSASWLSVPTGGTTSLDIPVTVDPSGLTPGAYQANILFTPAGAPNAPVSVSVLLQLASAAVLSTDSSSLNFVFNYPGAAPPAQTVNLAINGQPATAATSSVEPGSPWLSIANGAGSSISVSIDPSGLISGTYTGIIKVEAPGASNSPVYIPVTLTVVGAPSIQVSTPVVALTVPPGGAPVSTTLVLNSSLVNAGAISRMRRVGGAGIRSGISPLASGLSFNLDVTGSTWLHVSPLSGITPATITVTADPTGRRAGDYHGSIVVSSNGERVLTVPVNFVIGDLSALSASHGLLVFSFQHGDSEPPPVLFSIGLSDSAIAVSASVDQPWLTVTSSPPFVVSVHPDGLAPGVYHGAASLIPADPNSTLPSPIRQSFVELYVDQFANPQPAAVQSSMSYLESPLAPGMIFSIFGSGLGPAVPATTEVQPDGTLSRSVAGVQVLVNGIFCPLLYVSGSQINAIAPYALDGKDAANVTVQYLGTPSAEFPVIVSQDAPGMFTAGENGSGQGAILNQDWSVNSRRNPAAAGSIVSLFAGGGGQTIPPGIDGLLTSTDLLPPLGLPVSVTIGGLDAEVTYAGAAPTLVAGALQVNARIPSGVSSGPVAVVLKVGSVVSQSGVYVSVK
jgi:uncharacterized protein (TIGR03437 family)